MASDEANITPPSDPTPSKDQPSPPTPQPESGHGPTASDDLDAPPRSSCSNDVPAILPADPASAQQPETGHDDDAAKAVSDEASSEGEKDRVQAEPGVAFTHDIDDEVVDLEPKTGPEPPEWWHGTWPAGGIRSKQDLVPYLKTRLDDLRRARGYCPSTGSEAATESVRQAIDIGVEIATELARQAADNGHAYLARLGKAKPSRPSHDQLEYPIGIEGALEELLMAISPGWGKAELAEVERSGANPGQPIASAGSIFQVKRWNDMGLGIGDEKYVAISPCPEFGAIVTQARAIELPLKGQRWRDVLHWFAESEDGRTVKRSDLVYALGYALRQDVSKKTKNRKRDEIEEQKEGIRKLTSTMADLSREIRKLVATEDTTTVFEVVSRKHYVAAFTIRALWRDDENRLRFGRKF